MNKTLPLLLVVFGVFFLAGCGQQPAQVVPTLMPTLPPAELPTQTPPPTLALTPTPFVRATLPPTWTPAAAEATDSITAVTEVPPAADNNGVQSPAGKPTLEVCGPFGVNTTAFDPTFRVGNAVTVVWLPVNTAASYRINLIDDTETELFVGYTAETTFTFQADLFERGKRYGWSVYPMDALGQQMCFSVGNELFPQ
ncbi:MAG TPA: hypothetical protein VHO69_19695 [Phototrophicaceae bacterium]|nr:hypothetical protein [Phototrophicaceae bacterium]